MFRGLCSRDDAYHAINNAAWELSCLQPSCFVQNIGLLNGLGLDSRRRKEPGVKGCCAMARQISAHCRALIPPNCRRSELPERPFLGGNPVNPTMAPAYYCTTSVRIQPFTANREKQKVFKEHWIVSGQPPS